MEVLNEWSHHWNSVLTLLRESKEFINIASFGIHLPPKRVALALYEASEDRNVKVRMLIGRHEPQRLEAVNSILSLQAKLKDVSLMLPKAEVRVMTSHTKVVMNEVCAIVGGRNLSFSTWPDLSFRLWKSSSGAAFSDLTRAYDTQFSSALDLKKFLKVKRSQLEEEMWNLSLKKSLFANKSIPKRLTTTVMAETSTTPTPICGDENR
jgi:hypothetical protein